MVQSTRTEGSGPQPAGNGRPAQEGSEASAARILERSTRELADGLRELQILSSVASDRMRLRVRRGLEEARDGILTGAATATLLVVGIVLVGLGLAGAARVLFAGSPWLGELLAGGLLLAGALGWMRVRSARRERADLERLAAKYAKMEGSRRPHDTRPPSPHGRSPAGES